MTFDDWVDSKIFYELCQAYRHSGIPRTPEEDVAWHFEYLKLEIKKQHAIALLGLTT